jgi:penicillin-binding protein 2
VAKNMEKQRKNYLVKALFFSLLISLSLLVFRAVDLQGFQGSFFADISYRNRRFKTEIPAERGVFLDRYGDPLLINKRSYFQVLDSTALYSDQKPLTHEEALVLQVSNPFEVNYTLQREYLRPFSMAHVLGYVSGITADDLEEDNNLGFTDTLGRLGLESVFNDLVKGRKGSREFEINALGEKISESEVIEPVKGRNLETSLDPYLSTVALRAMGEKTGAVVILDADTGKVLALVSTPTFNSNLFSPSNIEVEQKNKLDQLRLALVDEKKLFFNRSISGTYPPGSIFKLVTALAGLESGAFDIDTSVDDQGTLEVGEYSYANWYYTQYGRTEGLITLVRAISRSNDIFFYKAAEWTGVEALVEQAEEIGFGSKTGLELTGEKSGLVPSPTWKEKTLGERWFLGNTFHMGIGQGDLLVTPLQQAQMIQVFGNGGLVCKPSVLADTDSIECSLLGAREENISIIQQGMIGACSPGGTAYPFFPWNEQKIANLGENMSPSKLIENGVVACKTGTAEFGAADERGYRKTHAWFGMTVGTEGVMKDQLKVLGSNSNQKFHPIDTTSENEKDLNTEKQTWLKKAADKDFPNTLSIVVLVESDDQEPFREGSRDAAPVANEIWEWIVDQE